MADQGPVVDFVVDPPLVGDLRETLIDLWTDVANAGGAVGFVPPVTRAEVEDVALAAFAGVASGHDHLVMATIGDEPIAFAFLERRPGPLFRHWATVRRLQVHPTLQRRGIGSRLLEKVHELAPVLDLEALHLTVRDGTGMEGFYESRGYVKVAEIPGVMRVAPGDDRNELYFVRRV